ncbi:hypothetical protein ETB97_008421 [Aspergillus alliaceus]|uniref:Cytochrome P450 n=1 Tax=Petromyces alliaceus TaxID=209559 RepID=A0A8H6E236_PETAA|nr:hypothetical protein ETB97_008421 [Aspergillus burnettii]
MPNSRKDGTTCRAGYHKSQDNTAYAQSSLSSSGITGIITGFLDCRSWFPSGGASGKKNGEKLNVFFSSLMEDKAGCSNNLEWGEIVAEVGAINASADTTAIALTQVLDMLIRHPKYLQRLRTQVDHALDEDEVIVPYDQVKNLLFLRACLDEALRLKLPTSAGLPRRISTEGAQIQWTTGDTSVSMTIYSAYRDPDIFPHPEEYNPDRWMDLDDRKRMDEMPTNIWRATGGSVRIGAFDRQCQ